MSRRKMIDEWMMIPNYIHIFNTFYVHIYIAYVLVLNVRIYDSGVVKLYKVYNYILLDQL